MLESSVLLSRVTRSGIVRKVAVEVGDMPKEQVQQTLRRVKELFEQRSIYPIPSTTNLCFEWCQLPFTFRLLIQQYPDGSTLASCFPHAGSTNGSCARQPSFTAIPVLGNTFLSSRSSCKSSVIPSGRSLPYLRFPSFMPLLRFNSVLVPLSFFVIRTILYKYVP